MKFKCVRMRGGRAGGEGSSARAGRPQRQSARALAMARWVPALVALLLVSAAARKSVPKTDHEPRIEEVTAKQLERLLTDKDFVAVFWCKLAPRQPHTCSEWRPQSPIPA